MKLLTLDIGTGTKDVLLYDSDRLLENCVKMVLTSPTVVTAGRIDQLESDVYLDGHVVGGGPLTHAVLRHQRRGYKVLFSPTAALAVKNTPRKMEEMGIVIGDDPGYTRIDLDELQLPALFAFLETLGEPAAGIDGFGLAVQDHGLAREDETDRSFRFETMLDHLARDPTLDAFVYTPAQLPDFFLRMRSAVGYVEERYPDMKMVLMDTCIAALRGCLRSFPPSDAPTLVLNVGNSHSMAAVLCGTRILAFFEHHTRILKKDPEKYVRYLTKLVAGSLTTDEVFADGGEGCFVFEPVGVERLERFLYTGPRRGILDGLEFPFPCRPAIAAPGGDMMMTGPVGLVDGFGRAFCVDLRL